MNYMSKSASALAVAVACVTAPVIAHAGLNGATVDVLALYPTATQIYADGGAKTVGAGIEYASGSFSAYNPSWQVDVGDNYIAITDATSNGLPYATATFNGWELKILSGPAITSDSVDASSTIVPVGAYISGGNLFINMSGVNKTVGGTTLINFTTAAPGVPEPATWAMMLVGVAGLGLALRRRRNTALAAV